MHVELYPVVNPRLWSSNCLSLHYLTWFNLNFSASSSSRFSVRASYRIWTERVSVGEPRRPLPLYAALMLVMDEVAGDCPHVLVDTARGILSIPFACVVGTGAELGLL